MDLTIHASFLPYEDPEASLAFWRDTLGFEVRDDVGYGGLRFITVGPADQPGTSIVLQPPAPPGCGVTDEERRTIVRDDGPKQPTPPSPWPPSTLTASSSGCRPAVPRVGRGTLPTPPAPVIGA